MPKGRDILSGRRPVRRATRQRSLHAAGRQFRRACKTVNHGRYEATERTRARRSGHEPDSPADHYTLVHSGGNNCDARPLLESNTPPQSDKSFTPTRVSGCLHNVLLANLRRSKLPAQFAQLCHLPSTIKAHRVNTAHETAVVNESISNR